MEDPVFGRCGGLEFYKKVTPTKVWVLFIYLFNYLFIYFCSFSEIFRTAFLENTSGQIFQE